MKSLVLCVLWGVARAQVGLHGTVDGPVKLKVQQSRTDIDSMPRMVPQPGVALAVVKKLNAALRRLDSKAQHVELACPVGRVEGNSRDVKVTMRGPRYLSITAIDEAMCAGKEQTESILALVYDLRTGGTVNWLKLIPAGAQAGVDDTAGKNKIGAVIWPPLTAFAREAADQRCKYAFDAESAVPFVMWLDAEEDAVKIYPSAFPKAQEDCAQLVGVPSEKARELGIDKRLLEALDTAHRMQEYLKSRSR